MKRTLALAFAAISIPLAFAKEPGAPEPALHYLSATDVAAASLLPPAPVDGSAAQKAELSELQAMAKSRTPQRLEQARFDAENISPVIFQSVIPGFDPAKLPLTVKVLEAAETESGVAAHMAKDYFDRNRPYETDPTLNVCGTFKKRNASYPSGHTTAGFAMAVTLGQLLPAKAQIAMARAVVYGESRMMCGVHYRSDVIAGQVVGTAVVLAMLQNPQFKADMAAARAELAAAGLTK